MMRTLTLAASIVMLGAPTAAAQAPRAPAEVAVYDYRVVRSFPHDRAAYTQGLFVHRGRLYESTGLNGQSSLRRVDLQTGRVLQRRDVAAQHFGEGAAVVGGRILQLTWRSQIGFIYDLATFRPLGTFRYTGEGWGLTTDGRRVIMSDGTSQLRFLDPVTLRETSRVNVTLNGRPVGMLNELEFVNGEVFANVYTTDQIVRINPNTGRVIGVIDLRGLLSARDRAGPPVDVLNGIAWDAAQRRLYVTGKLWPRLYEIQLIPRAAAPRRGASLAAEPAGA